jgi:RNA polymerase sigma-32 factor
LSVITASDLIAIQGEPLISNEGCNAMRTHSPTTDDSRYLRQIHCFPLLEAEEESSLARRWLENADGQAVHKILTSHLRLVPNVARCYRGYGLPLSDLISEGNVGLMQAAKRFDPEKGARFSTYAVWWIKATIQEYILRSWSLVKIGTTTSQRILFFKLRRMKNRIAAFQEGDMRPDQAKLIAEHLGVDEQDVVEMNRRLDGDMSLNVPVGDDDQAYEWQDRLVDERPNPEKLVGENDEFKHRQRALREALTTLGDRERYVFEMRRLADEPVSLEILAAELGVSRERVRQIEARAFEKVCRAVRQRGAAGQQIAAINRYQASVRAQEPKVATSNLLMAAEVGAPLCAD